MLKFCDRNAFLVYLEPIERVWWLQMSFFQMPYNWIWGATSMVRKEEGKRQEKTTSNFWLRRWSCMPYTHYECFEAVAYKNSRWEIGLYFAICRREAAVPCISIDRRLQTTSLSSLWKPCYTVARTRSNCYTTSQQADNSFVIARSLVNSIYPNDVKLVYFLNT